LETLNPGSERFILEEIALLQARGAEAIVLGCTELPLLVKQKDVNLPILDTTLLHAQIAGDFILGAAEPWERCRRSGTRTAFLDSVRTNASAVRQPSISRIAPIEPHHAA
jgi:hypothetical protein